MATSVDQFNLEIRAKIPSLALLGMQFIEFSPARVVLAAQFAPNKNHIDTVFGGSLYTACAAACYGLFRAMAEAHGYNEQFIVLKTGNIQYLKPVTKDFEVIAAKDPDFAVEKFVASVKKFGHGKLELISHVMEAGQICATFTGLFILRSKT